MFAIECVVERFFDTVIVAWLVSTRIGNRSVHSELRILDDTPNRVLGNLKRINVHEQ